MLIIQTKQIISDKDPSAPPSMLKWTLLFWLKEVKDSSTNMLPFMFYFLYYSGGNAAEQHSDNENLQKTKKWS